VPLFKNRERANPATAATPKATAGLLREKVLNDPSISSNFCCRTCSADFSSQPAAERTEEASWGISCSSLGATSRTALATVPRRSAPASLLSFKASTAISLSGSAASRIAEPSCAPLSPWPLRPPFSWLPPPVVEFPASADWFSLPSAIAVLRSASQLTTDGGKSPFHFCVRAPPLCAGAHLRPGARRRGMRYPSNDIVSGTGAAQRLRRSISGGA